mgnify:CR=1 FL=1
MVKIIGNPQKQNSVLKEIINKAVIDDSYILRKKDFRDEVLSHIHSSMTVLDIGKSMREKYDKIDCKEKKPLILTSLITIQIINLIYLKIMIYLKLT